MATAAERHNKPCFDRPACGGPLSDGYAGRRPSEPPGEHPQRPYGWCAPEAPPRRTGLLNAMTMIVPAGEGVRATEPPWYLRLAYASVGAGAPGGAGASAPITCSRAVARPSHPTNG